MQKPKSKRVKKEAAKPAAKKKQAAADEDEDVENNAEDGMYKLGHLRFVNVSDFKGKSYVNIREYYLNASNQQLPGKKGIFIDKI